MTEKIKYVKQDDELYRQGFASGFDHGYEAGFQDCKEKFIRIIKEKVLESE